jgi:hypothetical protein
VKAELESFDLAGLLRLHEPSRDNQAFLNARLRHGAAPLVSTPVGLVLWSEMEDEGMFKQALPALCGLPEAERSSILERLNHLRSKARRFGWG